MRVHEPAAHFCAYDHAALPLLSSWHAPSAAEYQAGVRHLLPQPSWSCCCMPSWRAPSTAPAKLVVLLCGLRMHSVYPTRTARFGVALVPSGVLRLKNACHAKDFR